MVTDQMRRVRDERLLNAVVDTIEDRARQFAERVTAGLLSPETAARALESSCLHDPNDTHSTTTNQLQTAKAVTCSGLADENSELNATLPAQPQTDVDADLEKHGIDAEFIMAIAPELCSGLRQHEGSWGEMVATAERLAGQSGISTRTFREACRVMGPHGAAASVIATLQKYRQGEVQRPGAYLQGMSSKALKGELNLGRTLHGLKDVSRGLAMRGLPEGTDAAPIGSLLSHLVAGGMTFRHKKVFNTGSYE
jgi:replication initiation protein RepC